jgi:alpha-galactosidase
VTGQLRADPKTLPNGYKAVIDYLHARKLEICAYSHTGGECSHYGTACFATACAHVSSLLTLPSPLALSACSNQLLWGARYQIGNEEQNVRQLADWGGDHTAVDNCANPNTTAQSVFEYHRVHDVLVKVGKPMIFGIWNVGSGKPWAWALQLGHH